MYFKSCDILSKICLPHMHAVSLVLVISQERMMTSFLLQREEEERVTSYSGCGESRIFRVYYK